MRRCLIIVDMLKDFIDEKGALYCGPSSRKIIPFIREKLDSMKKEGATIIFLADSHREDDLEFKLFPKHCVKGTKGAELIDELKVEEGGFFIEKTRFSGFYGTNLDEVLKNEGVEEVHLVGVCTSICVMETVSDLRNRDYKVIVHRNGVADFDPEAHEFSLRRMERILGAKVV